MAVAGIKQQHLVKEKEKTKERVKEKERRRHHPLRIMTAGSKLPKDTVTDRIASSVVKAETKVKDRQRFRLQYNKHYSSALLHVLRVECDAALPGILPPVWQC